MLYVAVVPDVRFIRHNHYSVVDGRIDLAAQPYTGFRDSSGTDSESGNWNPDAALPKTLKWLEKSGITARLHRALHTARVGEGPFFAADGPGAKRMLLTAETLGRRYFGRLRPPGIHEGGPVVLAPFPETHSSAEYTSSSIHDPQAGWSIALQRVPVAQHNPDSLSMLTDLCHAAPWGYPKGFDSLDERSLRLREQFLTGTVRHYITNLRETLINTVPWNQEMRSILIAAEFLPYLPSGHGDISLEGHTSGHWKWRAIRPEAFVPTATAFDQLRTEPYHLAFKAGMILQALESRKDLPAGYEPRCSVPLPPTFGVTDGEVHFFHEILSDENMQHRPLEVQHFIHEMRTSLASRGRVTWEPAPTTSNDVRNMEKLAEAIDELTDFVLTHGRWRFYSPETMARCGLELGKSSWELAYNERLSELGDPAMCNGPYLDLFREPSLT